MIPKINLKDFYYDLPEDKIAKFPLKDRDHSKLLVYKNGQINHSRFYELAQNLDSGSILFLNNTKVIPARLHFQRQSGAWIEILLLHPESHDKIIQFSMESSDPVIWSCMIGNLKKWKDREILEKDLGDCIISARLINREKFWVEISWNKKDLIFSEVLDRAGKIPIPPYFEREPNAEDLQNYQTVFAENQGAVAAPTAGLHFTEDSFESLKEKGIKTDYLTLHVGAGTFQPVKEHEDVSKHAMHQEQIIITKKNIINLLENHNVTAVGTTSMRTLESIFWYGQILEKNEEAGLFIPKLTPYTSGPIISREKSLNNVLNYLSRKGIENLVGETEILIMPGYTFQICDALITNFHLPETTLLLLISAFVGDDWKSIYREALEHNYRFLSYGDSSLLFKKKLSS